MDDRRVAEKYRQKIDVLKLDTLKIETNANMTVLGSVPEPATWAMAISGFGLLCGTLRRRSHAIGRAAAI